MADREFRKLEGALEDRVAILTGFLSITAAAAVDTANSRFTGGTFAAGGTGLYTLTLQNLWPKLLTIQLTPHKAATADTEWEVVSAPTFNGVANGQVITLRHKKSSDGSAVAPAAACGVHITIFAKNTNR